MNKHALQAKVRKVFGRKVRTIRRQGLVPGNVFGKKHPSVALELESKELLKVMREVGETGLVDLAIEGEKGTRPVLVAAYAKNPVTGALLHVDLHEVDLTVKTKANVPVKAVGDSPAVSAGNILVIQHNEIEVEALPADLPDTIEVDVTSLTEIGMSVLVKDLRVDKSKITLELDPEEIVVTIQAPAKEEVVAPVAPEGEGTATADEAKEGAESAKLEEKKAEPKAEK